jgi:hypothetical protein
MYLFRMRYPSARALLSYALALLVIVMFQGTALAIQAKQKTFETPEAAVGALVQALRDNSEKELSALLGPGSGALISSGDEVEDREQSAKFIRHYDEKNRLEYVGDKKIILHVGNNDWPFPIPIVKIGKNWRFDTKMGKEEILSRRIGRNELAAIQTCLAIVDAQREYATMDREGDGLLKYAQKFHSDKGKKNGTRGKTEPARSVCRKSPARRL